MRPIKADKPVYFSYDLSFQKKMVRVLFQDPDFACTTAARLQPDHFENQTLKWLSRTILTYAVKHGTGINYDALKIEVNRAARIGSVTGEAKGKLVAFLASMKTPVEDKSFVREEIYRFIKNQTTRTAIMNSVDHLETQDFESIDKEMQSVLEVQESLSGGLGDFYVRDIKQRTVKRAKFTKNGISTGLALDDYLKPAGLPPKSLGVVVAPAGKGKSHCLVHIGRSAILESRAKVLHVTLELSSEAVLDRYDAAFADLALNQLEEERKAVRRRVKQLGVQYGEFLVVKEFPPVTLTAPALRAYIRQLERVAFYPTLIIVDYADEMLPSKASRDSNAYEDMGGVYKELRKLSYDVNAPVWTASQTQRAALNKELIDLDSMADSFKKAMVADVVICLSQTREEKKLKQARFFVAKNRLGSDKFDFKVRLDWSRSTISPL
jgi:replicative DNA helicase